MMQNSSGLFAHSAMFFPAPQTSSASGGKKKPIYLYLGPPHLAELVNVLLEIDHDRFKKLFVDLMTKPIRKT